MTTWDFHEPSSLLSKMLIPRAPGSQNLTDVQDALRHRFANMVTPWHMLEDRFDADTPYGPVPMTNLVFTHDPEAERKLVLAAHTDSKYFPSAPDNGFVGATDSAAPCAIIVAVAEALTPWLDAQRSANAAARAGGDNTPRTTLSIVLLDGEEAFKDWTSTDSIYGAKCVTIVSDRLTLQTSRRALGSTVQDAKSSSSRADTAIRDHYVRAARSPGRCDTFDFQLLPAGPRRCSLSPAHMCRRAGCSTGLLMPSRD